MPVVLPGQSVCLSLCVGLKLGGVFVLLQIIFFVARLPWTLAPLTKPSAVSKEAKAAPQAAPLQVCHVSTCCCPAEILIHKRS